MIQFDIPWNTPSQWTEINKTLDFLVRHFSNELTLAFQYSEEIRQNLEFLFPIMADLCTATCPSCKEPCCRVAKLWYNFQDLLFLHLSGIQPPDSQPLAGYDDHCRYLGKTGCTLPRIDRPWICTWYICPPQTSLLRRDNRVLYKKADEATQEIKAARKEMEKEFIEVVSRL